LWAQFGYTEGARGLSQSAAQGGVMRWADVKTTYPDQWLIIEAIEARSEGDRRIVERLAVIETCGSGSEALSSYRRLHQQYPQREFYFVHTSRPELDIHQMHWVGYGLRSDSERHPRNGFPADLRRSDCLAELELRFPKTAVNA
jgi:hypothetical protein